MKKKQLFTMAGSLALVGAIGVGATLAYLSSQTDTLTNTFTVGENVDLSLIEHGHKDDGTIDNNNEVVAGVDEGVTFEDMLPGTPFNKDPYIKLGENSNDAFVYMEVRGIDYLLNVDFGNDNSKDFKVYYDNDGNIDGLVGGEAAPVINPEWVKIEDYTDEDTVTGGNQDFATDYDGIYVLKNSSGNIAKKANDVTSKLFNTVEISKDAKNVNNDLLTNHNIVIRAAAVQAIGVTDEDADNAAKALFK